MSKFNLEDMVYLIHDHGELVTLRSTTNGSYDPSTSSFTQTNSDTSVYGYFHKNSQGVSGQADVQRGNLVCAIAGRSLASAPTSDDLIISTRGTYHINTVETVYEAGEPVVYLCRVNE